jgi:hypothetical protein
MLNTSVECGLGLFGDPLHEEPEGLDEAAPVARLTRPVIKKVGDGVQCLVVMTGQISPFRKQLPEQSVGGLVAALLPRGCEGHRSTRVCSWRRAVHDAEPSLCLGHRSMYDGIGSSIWLSL